MYTNKYELNVVCYYLEKIEKKNLGHKFWIRCLKILQFAEVTLEEFFCF